MTIAEWVNVNTANWRITIVEWVNHGKSTIPMAFYGNFQYVSYVSELTSTPFVPGSSRSVLGPRSVSTCSTRCPWWLSSNFSFARFWRQGLRVTIVVYSCLLDILSGAPEFYPIG